MADLNLNTPVIVQATRLDTSILPRDIFSQSYLLYVIAQGTDVGNVANKANEAGQGAYEAQVRNEQQDDELADHELRIKQLRIEVDGHEVRITGNTAAIADLGVRITTVEGEVLNIQSEISSLDGRVTSVENDVGNLSLDYVSKTEVSQQSLSSPLNVTTSYSVGGVKVVGARQNGWTAGTGTPLTSAFTANQPYPLSTTYVRAEVDDIATGLIQARQRILALENALRTHGLIN
ncbi:phage tail protein [Escherichia sp. E4694]|uniref:phage tail protein n=1 Tax=Escherichia sp. E4694 TaxID=2044464 RepID=UPI00107FE380|nr:phage tail protein [Escherichia sp. E4694]TGB76317.1 phage tail protein [Escherichia sp. E4694]